MARPGGKREDSPGKSNVSEYAVTRRVSTRNAIIREHFGIVKRIARHFAARSRLPYADLEAEGCLGLMIAVDRFDPEKARRTGARFSSYAYWWVRRYILRAVIHQGLLVSVPENVSEMHFKYRQCYNRLAIILGRDPDPREVIDALALNPRQARDIMRREDLCEISLETPVRRDDETGDGPRLVENLAGRRERDLALALQREDQVEKCLAVLSEREREVVSLRFGLNGNRPMTYRELSEYYRQGSQGTLSRQRIHQVVSRAIEKIREAAGRVEQSPGPGHEPEGGADEPG